MYIIQRARLGDQLFFCLRFDKNVDERHETQSAGNPAKQGKASGEKGGDKGEEEEDDEGDPK